MRLYKISFFVHKNTSFGRIYKSGQDNHEILNSFTSCIFANGCIKFITYSESMPKVRFLTAAGMYPSF